MQIPLFKVFMDDSASSEVSKVLESGYIGQGSKVDEFEILLKDYLGTELLNTVNSLLYHNNFSGNTPVNPKHL